MRFHVELDLSGLEARLAWLAGPDVEATIRTTAQSEDGFYYWQTVNDGRGPIVPREARVLHWVSKEGEDVFAMRAGPVAPRHMIQRALPVIRQGAQAMAQAWQAGGEIGRETLCEFANQVAEGIAIPALQAVTPAVTGKLQESYEVERAT
jgi:hypothetical protein